MLLMIFWMCICTAEIDNQNDLQRLFPNQLRLNARCNLCLYDNFLYKPCDTYENSAECDRWFGIWGVLIRLIYSCIVFAFYGPILCIRSIDAELKKKVFGLYKKNRLQSKIQYVYTQTCHSDDSKKKKSLSTTFSVNWTCDKILHF